MRHTDSRPAYGRIKRLRRSVLRAAGRWTRKDYDVRLVFENDRPVYKQVVFKTVAQAREVGNNLRRYGPSAHLPALIAQRENSVFVEYVAGPSCRTISDALMPRLAECFADIAEHDSRIVPIAETSYPQVLDDQLQRLRSAGVADGALCQALRERAERLMPAHVRIGFDYTDPIGANLVQREDGGAICAIDIKNLKADTLVGQGLAKASARWLTPAREPAFFDDLRRRGLADIHDIFAFLKLFEPIQRISRKTARDMALIGRLRGFGKERTKLERLVE